MAQDVQAKTPNNEVKYLDQKNSFSKALLVASVRGQQECSNLLWYVATMDYGTYHDSLENTEHQHEFWAGIMVSLRLEMRVPLLPEVTKHT